MTQPPNGNATDEEREKLIDAINNSGAYDQHTLVDAILAAGFRLAPAAGWKKLKNTAEPIWGDGEGTYVDFPELTPADLIQARVQGMEEAALP